MRDYSTWDSGQVRLRPYHSNTDTVMDILDDSVLACDVHHINLNFERISESEIHDRLYATFICRYFSHLSTICKKSFVEGKCHVDKHFSFSLILLLLSR